MFFEGRRGETPGGGQQASGETEVAFEEADLDSRLSAIDDLSADHRLSEALEVCEQSMAMGPVSALLLLRHGDVLVQLDRHAEALTRYEQAHWCIYTGTLPPFPVPFLVCMNYATTLCVLGREEEALTLYEQALRYSDQDPALLVGCQSGKGQALLALHRPDEAAAAFDQALRAAGDPTLACSDPALLAILHAAMARSLIALQWYRAAQFHLNQALACEPTDEVMELMAVVARALQGETATGKGKGAFQQTIR